MTTYIVRRLAQAIPVLFGISILVYAILLAAPGGPQQRFVGNPRLSADDIARFRHAWGLDQPIPVQYCRWVGICNPDHEGTVLGILPEPAALIGNTGWPSFLPTAISGSTNGVLHGDFGFSIDSGEPVMARIARATLPTLILAGTALLIWITMAFL